MKRLIYFLRPPLFKTKDMDYKEKYEHGLECIQEILCGAGDSIKTSILRKRLQPFFPELKESEGERIRKALIEMIHDTTGDECEDCYHVSKGSVLAWLEKQGEKKNTRKREIDDAYLQGICDAKHEIEKQGKKLDADKVIEWLQNHLPNVTCYGYTLIEQFKKDFGL